MAAHLTDKQKKKIIADYAEMGTYSAVARKHNVSVGTVKRALKKDPETVRKVKQKKEQNTADVLAYMDTKKDVVCKMIELYLSELVKPEKLEKATVNQLSTALGTVIDKFTMSGLQSEGIEDLTPLGELLNE